MSAIAQYLAGVGKTVSGSDRYFLPGESNETRSKLEAEGIRCFLQDGEGINDKIDLVGFYCVLDAHYKVAIHDFIIYLIRFHLPFFNEV